MLLHLATLYPKWNLPDHFKHTYIVFQGGIEDNTKANVIKM